MNGDELVEAIEGLTEEERLALMDHQTGWEHPGRLAQRVIAGLLFALGSIWAVLLVLSMFLIVGIGLSVVFIFGWLIYGGWFYVMMGKRMSVSLSFFWLASILVHAIYGWIFTGGKISMSNGRMSPDTLMETGLAWWIPLGFSVVALGCEIWARRCLGDQGMVCSEDDLGLDPELD